MAVPVAEPIGDWLVKVAKACVGRTCDAIQASRDLERDYGTTIAPWRRPSFMMSSIVAVPVSIASMS